MNLQGNIVAGNKVGFGELTVVEDRISQISFSGEVNADADWILPGFIETHAHGMFDGEATVKRMKRMFECAPRAGVTTLCPAISSDSHENMCAYLRQICILAEQTLPGTARVGGAHLEGPFLDMAHKGGMNPDFVRMPDPAETEEFINIAGSLLKIVTLAPELPGADKVIELFRANGSVVSAGHCGLKPADVTAFADAGGGAVCHLFDAFDGREVKSGVSQVCLTDQVLIEDRLLLEIIPDGVHVPETLLKLAVRAAGVNRIVAITDSLLGAGNPDGIYPLSDMPGRFVRLINGDACRMVDDPDMLMGSCLTMNRAFYNLCTRFGFSEAEASQMTSGNPAKYLQFNDRGVLKEGLLADIVLLEADKLTVKECFIGGKAVGAQ